MFCTFLEMFNAVDDTTENGVIGKNVEDDTDDQS